jgi:hypothetical protein
MVVTISSGLVRFKAKSQVCLVIVAFTVRRHAPAQVYGYKQIRLFPVCPDLSAQSRDRVVDRVQWVGPHH